MSRNVAANKRFFEGQTANSEGAALASIAIVRDAARGPPFGKADHGPRTKVTERQHGDKAAQDFRISGKHFPIK